MAGAEKQPESVSDRHAHRFGDSSPLSLGVEEELLLVDGRRQLTAASELVLDRIPWPTAGRVSSEIFSEQIELKTGICHGPDEVLRQLRETRMEIASAGFSLLGSGLHPADSSEPSWSPSRATRSSARTSAIC